VPEEVPTNPWNSDEEKKSPTHKTPNIPPPPPHHGCAIPPPKERESSCPTYIAHFIFGGSKFWNTIGSPTKREIRKKKKKKKKKKRRGLTMLCSPV